MIKEAPRYFIDTVIKKPHTGYITYAVFDVNRQGTIILTRSAIVLPLRFHVVCPACRRARRRGYR